VSNFLRTFSKAKRGVQIVYGRGNAIAIKSEAELSLIRSSWEQSLRRAVEQLPDIEFQSLGSEKPA
jgi:predicted proteasome-type protease